MESNWEGNQGGVTEKTIYDECGIPEREMDGDVNSLCGKYVLRPHLINDQLDHFSCNCQGWRMGIRKKPANARSCKHLKAWNGDKFETARILWKMPQDGYETKPPKLRTPKKEQTETKSEKKRKAPTSDSSPEPAKKVSPLKAKVVVIGHESGKGKYEGLLGSLKCEFEGEEFKVSSGLSKELRRSPPRIGTEITIKYRELTKNGVPRYPSVD